MTFKDFLAISLAESTPEYKFIPSHVANEFFILIGQDGMVKIKLQLLNYNEKKGYDAKLTFTGGEKNYKTNQSRLWHICKRISIVTWR